MTKETLNYGYEAAFQMAREDLATVDIAQQCIHSGAICRDTQDGKIVVLEYLSKKYEISLPEASILTEDKQPVPIKDRILMLHYFNQAAGVPLSGKMIAYSELPGGMTYLPTFNTRAIRPVVDNFGQEPTRLLDIARKLGGQRADYGDTAVTIKAFPRVPVTFILWGGDDEFPAQGNILFDSTVMEYLTIEDVNILCEIIAWKLVRLQKMDND